LALSATLDRYGDPVGTKKLYDFFGTKCIEYSLKEAIQQGKLTSYNYYPVLVNLTIDELDSYKELTNKIIQMHFLDDGELFEMPDALKRLLLKRARIIAGAQNKVIELKKIMEKYKKQNNMLIYCGAVKYGQYDYDKANEDKRQMEVVIDMLNKEYSMKLSKFTSEEDAIQRQNLIRAFKNEEIQALVAIKCLDEGMNIPAIKTAFILASSTNPKEYIQRRGRVLRKYEGKQFAEIYDFITISRPLDEASSCSEIEKRMEQGLVLKELNRLTDFAYLSNNPTYSNKIKEEIINAYDLSKIVGGKEFEY
jgi:superfamily II DNA or RNA helicase